MICSVPFFGGRPEGSANMHQMYVCTGHRLVECCSVSVWQLPRIGQQQQASCCNAGMIPQARKPIPAATPMTPPSHALQEMNGIPPASMYTASAMRPTPSPGKFCFTADPPYLTALVS